MEQEQQVALRVIKVPLRWTEIPDEQYKEIRSIGYKCASYGNLLLSESYARAKAEGLAGRSDGVSDEFLKRLKEVFKELFTTYTDFSDQLASVVRDAIGREVVGMWRRLGKEVLSGRQTLGRFHVGRSIVVRERGVRLFRRDEQLVIQLRLQPKPVSPIQFMIHQPPKNIILKTTLSMLLEHPERIRKATLCFDRRNARKMFVFLSYEKPYSPQNGKKGNAEVLVLSDGTMRVHANGHALSLTDYVYRMVAMKENIARIHARLRAHLGRKGRWDVLRKKLKNTSSFEEWVQGPLHQLSRAIIRFCAEEGVGEVVCSIDPGAPELPWHALQAQVKYKGEEVGIISQTSPGKKQKGDLRKKREEGVPESGRTEVS